MAHTDWIPTRDADLVNLAKRWILDLMSTTKQTAYGWDPAECAACTPDLGTYAAAQKNYEDDNSTANRIVRDNARHAAVAAMRDFAASSIRHNKKMQDQEKAWYGVHIADKIPTRRPVPATRPVFAGPKPLGGFRVEFPFHDENTPDSRAILAGCNGCVLLYRWGQDRVTDYELLAHSVLMTRSPFTHTFPPEAAGQTLSYAGQWQNDRGEKGPWSDIGYCIIA
ncbi:MAG: hypothetical protein LBD09_06240 [Treponema sp.]|jgi:hypothetical protein|nr:hypothetical protein [Treponema sp.]